MSGSAVEEQLIEPINKDNRAWLRLVRQKGYCEEKKAARWPPGSQAVLHLQLAPHCPGGGQVQLALISVFRVPNDEVLRPARALFPICSDPPLTPHFTGKAAVINLVTYVDASRRRLCDTWLCTQSLLCCKHEQCVTL
jgi:hypothetical protein